MGLDLEPVTTVRLIEIGELVQDLAKIRHDCPDDTLSAKLVDLWVEVERLRAELARRDEQITAVEQVQALPARSVIVGADGYVVTLGVVNKAVGWQPYIADLLERHGPFAVVWRPMDGTNA